ncbi:MAG: sialate O-acetylesterase [Bifidobacterium sp.]|nr:sialate O-acetylesterase [Bifidobacterium sp.]
MMLELAKLLGDGCVMQSGRELLVWGWAEPGAVVTVALGSHAGEATCASDGSWQVRVGALEAGGPYLLAVESAGERLERRCYAGEVFLCAGQSNMELPMRWVRPYYPAEFDRQADPLLRQFKVDADWGFSGPVRDHASARWQPCAPDDLGDFSAVAYFFGRMVRALLDVPVGLLNVSLGGSPIESWMDADTLRDFPSAMRELEPYLGDGAAEARRTASLRAIDEWMERLRQAETPRGELAWHEVHLPGAITVPGGDAFHGLLELHRTVVLPPYHEGAGALLRLGNWVDGDETYVNGVHVGASPSKYEPRDYAVPPGILHAGANEVRVRLVSRDGAPRVTEGKAMALRIGDETYDLSGAWRMAVASRMDRPCPAEDFVRWKPTALYHTMLEPCQRWPVRAVLWYQGESDTGDQAADYARMLTAMIGLWRRGWREPDLPFLVVQLPCIDVDCIEDGGWPLVRAAQWKVGQQDAHTMTVVTLDAGEANDLHPHDKRLVASRLFGAARAMLYGGVGVQPEVVGVEETDGLLRLTYGIRRADGVEPCGLVTLDGAEPGEFEFVWLDAGTSAPAHAVIEDGAVLIDLAARRPDLLRYAWHNDPHRGLLADGRGTPVPPSVHALGPAGL